MIPYSRMRTLLLEGGANYFEISAPVSGTLNRLIVHQEDGALDGFDVEIFTSESPASSDDSYSEVDDDAGVDASLFRVLPAQSVSASSATLALYEKNFGYEVNELAGEGRRKTALFVKLTVAGSGAKTFRLSYLIFGYNPY